MVEAIYAGAMGATSASKHNPTRKKLSGGEEDRGGGVVKDDSPERPLPPISGESTLKSQGEDDTEKEKKSLSRCSAREHVWA